VQGKPHIKGGCLKSAKEIRKKQEIIHKSVRIFVVVPSSRLGTVGGIALAK
jgi:hypothetical protein